MLNLHMMSALEWFSMSLSTMPQRKVHVPLIDVGLGRRLARPTRSYSTTASPKQAMLSCLQAGRS